MLGGVIVVYQTCQHQKFRKKTNLIFKRKKVKMKKILFCMLVMLTALCLSTRAEAGLFTRGVDDNKGNRLIYDDDLDITWYDFSNAPATFALLGIGLTGLAGAEARRRRKKKAVDRVADYYRRRMLISLPPRLPGHGL